jgi:hypothetical protein
MAAFLAAVEESRGRKIELIELPADIPGHAGASGLWISLRDRPVDLILYVADIPKFHRRKVVFHELAHLWLGDGQGGQVAAPSVELSRFLPRIPAHVGRVVARGSYTTHAEARAEMLADLLHYKVRQDRIATEGRNPRGPR